MIARPEVMQRRALHMAPEAGVRTHAGIRAFLDAHVHVVPISLLWLLTIVVMRRWLFTGGLPAGSDSAFLYSSLPYYSSHHLFTFDVWLSSPMGQVQQYSIYWFLAMLSRVVPDPIVLFKAASFVVALVASTGMYALGYSLFRSRVAATVAAGLYAFSPFVISHWLAGHLNIEISLAVGPLAVLALLHALRRGRFDAMIGLGLSASALYLVTTAQGVYWLLPLGAIVAFECLAARRTGHVAPFLMRLTVTTALAIATFAIASAVQLLPLLRGAAAPFVAGTQRYYIEGLQIHEKYSLSFISGVTGVPREHWLDPTFHLGAMPFSSVGYQAAGMVIVGIALLSLAGRHRRLAAQLLPAAVLAWLLAAGPTGPIRPIYLTLYDHLPYFRFLRVPNRWLMVSVFVVSLLAAASVDAAAATPSGLRLRRRRTGPARIPTVGAAMATVLVVAGLLVSMYPFLRGLPTWNPPGQYVAAYSALARDREDWRILTTPFFQSWMETGRPAGDDVSLSPDLGYTSTLWHGHATLGRGGWDPRAARIVSYIYELTKQGANRSVSKLLGAMGVKYIALNPHPSTEVIEGQNPFFASQQGLRLVFRGGGIRIYQNTHYLPQAFVTPRWCVVAGGLGLLGDLARQSSFSFGEVGLQFADQLRATQGVGSVRNALDASGCVIAAPHGLDALRVQRGAISIHPVDEVAPAEWTREDVPASLDIGAEPSLFVHVPHGGSFTGTFSIDQGGDYALWLSAPRDADQGTLRLRIDGRRLRIGSLPPELDGGVTWQRSQMVRLRTGMHRFSVANAGRNGVHEVRLVDIAVMGASAAGWSPEREAGLTVIREVDVTSTIKPPRLTDTLATRWEVEAGLRARSVRTAGATLSLAGVRSGRRYFTIARSQIDTPVDPERPFGINFTGAGTGQFFYLNFLFDANGYERASFRFRDSTSQPRRLLFSPLHPSAVTSVPDWSRVRQITLSTNSKGGWPGRVTIGGPFLAESNAHPDAWRPIFVQSGSPRDPFAGDASARDALRPRSQPIAESATLDSGVGEGLLVFTQAFDPNWRVTTKGRALQPSVALGFANGYEIDRRRRPAEVAFRPAVYGRVGTMISLAGWLGFGAVLISRRRRRSSALA